MAKQTKNKTKDGPAEVHNRRARHEYEIGETLECGMVLAGSEVKAVRDGNISIAEGYVTVDGDPPRLTLRNVTIGEYPPAGAMQHEIGRTRRLLAHKREIRRLARQVEQKGVTLVPLKVYFKDGWAKVLVGVGTGKKQYDKRESIKERDIQRDIQRAMSRKA